MQIAYLPTLYSAFNRRENEVALLNDQGGFPAWGPELLARTHYALGSGVSTVNTLPDLYADWERWAADVGESHTTYLPLVWFRSPKPLSSWVTSLLAVLDSAALMLSLNPSTAPVVPARLCLRAGFTCFGDVARAMGFSIPLEPDPEPGHQHHLRGLPRSHQPAGGSRTSRSSAVRRTPGPTSSAGGSTTRTRPSPSPEPSTRCLPCGQARGGTRTGPHPADPAADGPPAERQVEEASSGGGGVR